MRFSYALCASQKLRLATYGRLWFIGLLFLVFSLHGLFVPEVLGASKAGVKDLGSKSLTKIDWRRDTAPAGRTPEGTKSTDDVRIANMKTTSSAGSTPTFMVHEEVADVESEDSKVILPEEAEDEEPKGLVAVDDIEKIEKGKTKIFRSKDLLKNDKRASADGVLSIIKIKDIFGDIEAVPFDTREVEENTRILSIQVTHDGSETPATAGFVYIAQESGHESSAKVTIIITGQEIGIGVEWDTTNAPNGRISEDTDTSNKVKIAGLSVVDSTRAYTFGVDGEHFHVVGKDLYLDAGVKLDHEKKPFYSFTISAIDEKIRAMDATAGRFVGRPETLWVTDPNDAPVAVADLAEVEKGSSVDIDVLRNDKDGDADPLVPIIVEDPRHGRAEVLAAEGVHARKIRYTHDGSDTTHDVFTYKVDDGKAESLPAEVIVDVEDVIPIGPGEGTNTVPTGDEDIEIKSPPGDDPDVPPSFVDVPPGIVDDDDIEFDPNPDNPPPLSGFQGDPDDVVDIIWKDGPQPTFPGDVTVCLPAGDEGGEEWGLYRYDRREQVWRKLTSSRFEERDGSRVLCGETDRFSLFAVLSPDELWDWSLVAMEWLARFGRTVASQTVDIVHERLEAPVSLRQVTLGGRSVVPNAGSVVSEGDGAGEMQLSGRSMLDGTGIDGRGGRFSGESSARDIPLREFWNGTSFEFSPDDSVGNWSLWGRVAFGEFSSDEEDAFSLNGEVVSSYMGADWRGAEIRGGLMVSQSGGSGTFTLADHDAGSEHDGLDPSLTSGYTWFFWSPREDMHAWGLVGFGDGYLSMTEKAGTAQSEHAETANASDAGIGMRLAASGVRAALPSGRALNLTLKVDMLSVWMWSDPTARMLGTQTDVQRLHALLEAGSVYRVSEFGWLEPHLEAGLRMDAGDAEKGLGTELGGGLTYGNVRSGLEVSTQARGIIAHRAAGFSEWSAHVDVRLNPGADRQGLSFTFSPSWETTPGGDVDLWDHEEEAWWSTDDITARERLDMSLSYGVLFFNGRFLSTPYVEAGFQDDRLFRLRSGVRHPPTDLCGEG